MGIAQRQAAIYVRISQDKVGAGLGVQRQEEDCRPICQRRGFAEERIKVYIDNDLSAFSGRRRPAYEELLHDVEAGLISLITAWHPDRLHRRPIELEHFIDLVEGRGVEIETVRAGTVDLATPSGRMVARMLGAAARYESEHKADRSRRKHLELALAGKDAGGSRPFGYEEDRRTVRPREAALVREGARRVLAGESLRSIIRDWTARGVPTVTGKPWTVTVLKRILVGARISGRREAHRSDRFIGRITAEESEYEAIIAPEQSDQLRRVLADPNRTTNRVGGQRRYLLTGGLARCGLCGRPLVARPKADGRRCYVCASGPSFGGCGKIRILAQDFEVFVASAAVSHADQGGIGELLRERDDAGASDELLRINGQLGELARAWAEERLTRVEWEAARSTYAARQRALEARIEAGRRTYGLDDLPDPLTPAWPTLPLHQQRAVVAAFLEGVIVHPAIKGRNFFTSGRVELRWRA